MTEFRLETERLILRDWRDADLVPFAAMCADPRVMATLGPQLTREETAALIGRLVAIREASGITQWALERREDSRFIGWCGLSPGTFWPIEGRIEVGWRLAFDCWGQGYAREGALAALAWGFAKLAPDSIWAITSRGNTRSWGLMERLGMTRRSELDFDHPKIAEGNPLRPHITYSLTAAQWSVQ